MDRTKKFLWKVLVFKFYFIFFSLGSVLQAEKEINWVATPGWNSGSYPFLNLAVASQQCVTGYQLFQRMTQNVGETGREGGTLCLCCESE